MMDSKFVHEFIRAWTGVHALIEEGWEFDLQYANFNETPGEPLDYEWWCSFMYYTDDEDDHRMVNKGGATELEALRAALEEVKNVKHNRSSRERQGDSGV